MSLDILSKDSPPDIIIKDLKREEERGPPPTAPAKARKHGTKRLVPLDERLKIEFNMYPETKGTSAVIKVTLPQRQWIGDAH